MTRPRQSGIVRVYRKEPVLMHTTAPAARHGTARGRARRYAEAHFADRLPVDDVEVSVEAVDTAAGTSCTGRVVANIPVLKGEFKNHDLAKEWLCRQQRWDHCEVEIVLKNSVRDHEIRAFGVKRQL